MPATSQLDWLISMTATIVLFWSRATRDLLKSFGWGIAGTPSIRVSGTQHGSPQRMPMDHGSMPGMEASPGRRTRPQRDQIRLAGPRAGVPQVSRAVAGVLHGYERAAAGVRHSL